jgi:ADP-heptose:LPS heptosyltransferase
VACAVGTPVVAVFGPGHLKKWQPQGQRHSIITNNVACAPCTAYGYTVPTCHGTFHCMRGINMSERIR